MTIFCFTQLFKYFEIFLNLSKQESSIFCVKKVRVLQDQLYKTSLKCNLKIGTISCGEHINKFVYPNLS